MWEGTVLESVAEAAYRRQTRREAGGVPVHDMRARVLLAQLPDDPHIHVPQVAARGHGANSVFLVTAREELATRAHHARHTRHPPSRPAPPHAPAHGRRHQRAAGVSLLPQDLLLLLLAEAALPRQARAVGHAVRVRVLPPEVPHQELADDAQEPAAPRLQRDAEAAAEDVGAARRAAAAAPVRAAAAARPAMTAHGLSPPAVPHHGLCPTDARTHVL